MMSEKILELGESVTHEGAGVVVGDETGRIIAKFSHESEAEGFCELVNSAANKEDYYKKFLMVCSELSESYKENYRLQGRICRQRDEIYFLHNKLGELIRQDKNKGI